MRWVMLILLGGCASVGQEGMKSAGLTCAPRSMVVGCLNEAFRDEPDVGLGPWCSGLASWARAEGWELGSVVEGGGVIAEREAEEGKRRADEAKRHRDKGKQAKPGVEGEGDGR